MKYIIIIAVLMNSCTVAEVAAPPRQPDVRTKTLTLPQKCEYLRTEHDPATWNPVTETYPTNHAWQECMGVGVKS